MKLVDVYNSGTIPLDGKLSPDKERAILADIRANWTMSLLYRSLYVPENVVTHMNRVTLVLLHLLQLFPDDKFTHQQKALMTLAAQTHDLANIIKFKEFSKELAQQEFIWRIIQDYITTVWGTTSSQKNEHAATNAMVEAIGIPPAVSEIIGATDHLQLPKIQLLSELLLWYADMRVSPRGVTSFKGRLHDVKRRYPRPVAVDATSSYQAEVWDSTLQTYKTKASHVARNFSVSTQQLRRFVNKYEVQYPDPYQLADAIVQIFYEMFGDAESVQAV